MLQAAHHVIRTKPKLMNEMSWMHQILLDKGLKLAKSGISGRDQRVGDEQSMMALKVWATIKKKNYQMYKIFFLIIL